MLFGICGHFHPLVAFPIIFCDRELCLVCLSELAVLLCIHCVARMLVLYTPSSSFTRGSLCEALMKHTLCTLRAGLITCALCVLPVSNMFDRRA